MKRIINFENYYKNEKSMLNQTSELTRNLKIYSERFPRIHFDVIDRFFVDKEMNSDFDKRINELENELDKIQQEYKQKRLIEEEINSLLPRVHRFLDDLVQMKHICEYHDNLLYNANNNLTDKIMELREKSKNKKIDEN